MRRVLLSCALALIFTPSLAPTPALSETTRPMRPVMSRQDVAEEAAASSSGPVIVALFAVMLLIALAGQNGGSSYPTQ